MNISFLEIITSLFLPPQLSWICHCICFSDNSCAAFLFLFCFPVFCWCMLAQLAYRKCLEQFKPLHTSGRWSLTGHLASPRFLSYDHDDQLVSNWTFAELTTMVIFIIMTLSLEGSEHNTSVIELDCIVLASLCLKLINNSQIFLVANLLKGTSIWLGLVFHKSAFRDSPGGANKYWLLNIWGLIHIIHTIRHTHVLVDQDFIQEKLSKVTTNISTCWRLCLVVAWCHWHLVEVWRWVTLD